MEDKFKAVIVKVPFEELFLFLDFELSISRNSGRYHMWDKDRFLYDYCPPVFMRNK